MLPLSDDEIGVLRDRGWFCREGLIDKVEALQIRNAVVALDDQGRTRAAKVGGGARVQVDLDQRRDRITWLLDCGDVEALKPLNEIFEGVRIALNEGAWLGLRRFDVQLAFYAGQGGFYKSHRDSFPGRANRIVTAILYLNLDWVTAHGGALMLHVEPVVVEVAPIAGRLVVFMSEVVEHEVLPVFSPRVAATAWFYQSEPFIAR